jgi:hypothetical protein
LALVLEEQVFIVHRKLIIDLLGNFENGLYSPVLVDFPSLRCCDSTPLLEIRDFCRHLISVLEQEEENTIIKIDHNLKSPSSVAGLLLSYVIIYYSDNTDAKLLHAEVGVFSVYTESPQSRILMQFSCPPDLLETAERELMKVVSDWESRISALRSTLQEKWRDFTGVESCTLKIRIETRRVPILSL